MSITENLTTIQTHIDQAKKRSAFSNPCTLIAVSKTKPVEMLTEAYHAGIREFGENKVQELVEKYECLPKDIHWHMIGHLQTNKVKYIIDKVALIHSVESDSLAAMIDKEAKKHGRIMPILVEVNIGDEESKFGVSKSEAKAFVNSLLKYENIKVCGLMCVAPYVENPEKNRQHFVALRQLSVDIANENKDNIISGKLSMDILSMGMSGDYEVAVEEGASFVRVGSSIFGERNYNI